MKDVEFDFPSGKKGFILQAKNAIDKEVCDLLVSECKKNYNDLFIPGPTLGGINPFIKSSMDFSFSASHVSSLGLPSDNFATYEKIIADSLFACLAYYQKTYDELWDWPGIRDTGFRLQHYVKNFGHYRKHVDGTAWGGPNSVNRVLAGIVYLNDVAVGGDTYFEYQDVSVKAECGTVALFPTAWTHPHQGNPGISGDKWIISTFYITNTVSESNSLPQAIEEKSTDE